MKTIERIFDAITGETTDIERDILDARGVALDLAFRGFDHFK